MIADHCALIFHYHTKTQPPKPKFKFTRNFNQLSSEALIKAVENNPKLQSIYDLTDPDDVAEVLSGELNKIIKKLAPQKRIQIKKDHLPYFSTEIRAEIALSDHLLTKAIHSNIKPDWVAFKIQRNKTFKLIKAAKAKYLESKLNHPTQGWKFVTQYSGLPSQTTPNLIKHNGISITSPKQKAEIANTHYIQKVKNITSSFNHITYDPLKLLNKVVPRNSYYHNLNLSYISIKETNQLIRNLKNTYSTGEDVLCNIVIKRLGFHISYQICHMINCVMCTGKFPKIFKTTRIIPVSKPGKSLDDFDSFRPINNLPCLGKILEDWICKQVTGWLTANNVMSNNHHGGRQGYSTLTAKTEIENAITKNLNENKYNVLLTTDLSAAFDTVDHVTLLRKMDHYGIRGHALKLMRSYSGERSQFVEIETFRSILKPSLNLSTIQGSKMANIFFTIYTNVVPHIHNIFRCPRMLERFFEVDPWVDSSLVGLSDQSGASTQPRDQDLRRPLHLSTTDLIKTYTKPNRSKSSGGGGGAPRANDQAIFSQGSHENDHDNDTYISINNISNNIPYGQGRDIHGNDKFSGISHETTCFVDDASSVAGFKLKSQILAYIRDYMERMGLFYASNKLKLNPSQSHFCISGTVAQIAEISRFALRLHNEIVTNSHQVRVLGYLFNSTNDSQINELVQSFNYRLVSLSKISKYCRQKTIVGFIQAYVIGKLNYRVSAYMSSPAYQLSKLDKVIVRAARISVGAFKAQKMSNDKLLAECGFRSIRA